MTRSLETTFSRGHNKHHTTFIRLHSVMAFGNAIAKLLRQLKAYLISKLTKLRFLYCQKNASVDSNKNLVRRFDLLFHVGLYFLHQPHQKVPNLTWYILHKKHGRCVQSQGGPVQCLGVCFSNCPFKYINCFLRVIP